MSRHILSSAIGFLPIAPSAASSTQAINAANTWHAMSFIGNGKTISKIELYVSAEGGTVNAADVTLEIYSTGTTGDPNASLSGPHNCDQSDVNAGAWYSWSPSYATTDGTMYWVVMKNADGAPATNFSTFRHTGAGSLPVSGSSITQLWGWNKNVSTDAGSTWTGEFRGVGGMVLTFDDTTYDGTPFSQLTTSTDRVYASRELGVLFPVPAGPTLNVDGVVLFFSNNTGTPSAAARARLWTSGASPSNIATSTGGPVAGQIGAGWAYFPFASAQALSPSTSYRMTLGTTGADTSSNAYNMHEYTVMDQAYAKALLPFGSWQKTYFDGTNWTDTSTACLAGGLVLANGGEFTVSASSGGHIIGG